MFLPINKKKHNDLFYKIKYTLKSKFLLYINKMVFHKNDFICYLLFNMILCYYKYKGVVMNKEERLKIYKQAETLWGLIAQYDQAVEEMAELIVAINKYKRKCLYGEYANNPKVENALIEEIADVKMCLEQLEDYMGSDRVNEVFDKKMQKLLDEIEKMKKIKKDNK